MRYRRTGNWLEAQVNDELLMMHGDSGRFISLNETGAYLWACLAEPKSPAALADGLCAGFEVEPLTARADVDAWLDAMRAEKMIEEDAA
jgi:hypothetical protein